MKRLLLIPRISVQNANALSSPYTIGFPAMTAWLGAVHALQRSLNETGFADVRLDGVGVVCHECRMQTYRGQGDFVYSIVGTGNPLDKDGKRPPFIEEGRCHLTVSLVIEYDGLGVVDRAAFMEAVTTLLHQRLKIAGGDIINFGSPELIAVGDEKSLRSLTRKLMPGYLLVERRDLMISAMGAGQDAIDALLDYLSVKHRCHVDESENVYWTSQRKTHGWIVPIATGFQSITDLGRVTGQRDFHPPHRFAESIVTLGEFVMPYRVRKIDEMLWYYRTDLENDLYLCEQKI